MTTEQRIDMLRGRIDGIRDDIQTGPDHPSAKTLLALTECLDELCLIVDEERQSNTRVVNTASCLANGIKPD